MIFNFHIYGRINYVIHVHNICIILYETDRNGPFLFFLLEISVQLFSNRI
jgi:hypothetical protein